MHEGQAAATTLARLIGGASLARMISVAAEFGIADLLANGPRTCTVLAAAAGTDFEFVGITPTAHPHRRGSPRRPPCLTLHACNS